MTSVLSDTGLYVEVQQFYARQMRKLDRRELEAYAATFTEDGVFGQYGAEPARTREGILRFLVDYHRQFENDPVQRRHHFTMLDVRPSDDGTIAASYYAMTYSTRPGGATELGASCEVDDVLVREDGDLCTRSRLIQLDKNL